MTNTKTEVFLVVLEHSENPNDCERCFSSPRAACPNCGHSLTGLLRNGSTVCEKCGTECRTTVGGTALLEE